MYDLRKFLSMIVGGKAIREHFEAINHRNAIYFVEDILSKEEPFSE